MTILSTKFDHVVSFGCSLARGDELADTSKRYSKIVANNFKAALVDHSVVGLSNEIISQKVVNHLLANKHNGDPSKTLVLVEWSFASRLNFCGKSNRYYVIAQYNMDSKNRKIKLGFDHTNLHFNDDFDDLMDVKNYYDIHANLTYMYYNMIKYIHHVQLFLKNRGYNYIFLFASDFERELVVDGSKFDVLGLKESDYMDCYPYFKYMIDDIDKNHICDTAFIQHARSINCKFGPFHHPLEDGHISYSKILIDFIESKYGKQVLRGSQSGVS